MTKNSAAHRLLMVPQLFSSLKEGYSKSDLRADFISGLTVAIVALPLCMALAAAVGLPPEKGLLTGIIGGFIISAFGGSRHQIGGPAAAFIVILLNIINTHGYDGMLLASFMGGLLLIAAGMFRLGNFIKYIPYPVIIGFTSGIAATIFITQLKELLGFDLSGVVPAPRDTLHVLGAYMVQIKTINLPTVMVGLGSVAMMMAIRKFRPNWPMFLIGTVVGAILAFALHYFGVDAGIATIHSKFGAIKTSIPALGLPDFSLEKAIEVFPSALTIAFLAGIEGLLSAVVADGMTGHRHRSNIELVAQGAANCMVSLVGGIPATGTIARTATNIRSGARTPISGIIHALCILLFLMVAAPLAGWIPLSTLAAILVIVAMNISEVDNFKRLMKAPRGDRAVLLTTFTLTVLVDLTEAIKVGVVMAALLFMHRMSELVAISTHNDGLLTDSGEEGDNEDDDDELELPPAEALPPDIEVYQINGPFFFGAASYITDVLDKLRKPPRAMIIRMHAVPMMDASGIAALMGLVERLYSEHCIVILCDTQNQPKKILKKMGITDEHHGVKFARDFASALHMAKELPIRS